MYTSFQTLKVKEHSGISICENQYNFDKHESYAVKSNETLTGLKALNKAIPLRRRGWFILRL